MKYPSFFIGYYLLAFWLLDHKEVHVYETILVLY